MARLTHLVFLAAVSIIAAAAFAVSPGLAEAAPTAVPAPSCSPNPYAYAGLFSNQAAQGIEAVVTTLAAAQVPYGHVAGWIGVGGVNAGPNGQAEWLQTGVVTMAGNGSELYAEITQPGQGTKYVTLAAGVVPGSTYKLAVLQIPGKPGTWQVMVNGAAATDPVYLPGSSSFQPMVMSESWNGGNPACNGFAYRFDNVQITTKGTWQALTDASAISDSGYKILDRTKAGFTALSA